MRKRTYKRARFPSARGFTYIELILALIIIFSLLGLSFPLVKKNLNRVHFRSVVNRVYLLLDYAATSATLRNKAVTVEFDSDISEPADWMDAFILKETEDGPTICDDVVYNAAGKRATCEHAELTPNTNYLVVVTDITAVNGQQTNFTTED